MPERLERRDQNTKLPRKAPGSELPLKGTELPDGLKPATEEGKQRAIEEIRRGARKSHQDLDEALREEAKKLGLNPEL